jgi:hypothetical protein
MMNVFSRSALLGGKISCALTCTAPTLGGGGGAYTIFGEALLAAIIPTALAAAAFAFCSTYRA